jgi:hypothetical protein
MKKNIAATFIFALIFSATNAQLRKTIRGEFQLPRATWNPAFTKTFSGVFNAGLSFNMAPKKDGFSYGAFYSLTQYQVFPKFFDDPHVIQTNHTFGAKIHYDMLTSSGKGMFSPFIAPGYSLIKYTRIKVKNHPAYQTESNAMSVNIGMAYNIMMDEWTGAGFIIGFNMIDHVFMPENVALDEWSIDYKPKDKKGSFKNIFFGFSVYFDLAWKPETSQSN